MSEQFTVQRFRGSFAIVWRDEHGTRRRRRLYAENRPSAEAEARRVWAAGDDTPWTMARIMDGYIASLVFDEKPSAVRRKDAWKAMRSFWAGVDPNLIDPQMCKDYTEQRGAAPGTIRYELLQISTSIAWARAEQHTTATPKMWLPKAAEPAERHLSPREFDRLLDAARAPHAKLYMLLGIYTMARPAAILDLIWDQIDFETGLINLNPPGRRQTRKKRPTVPMGDDLRAELQQAHAARQTNFVIERGGKKVANIKKAFQAASDRSGVKATPYSLRHTGAVWAAGQGVSMAKLAQFMGHDDDSVTQRHYAKFQPDHLMDVANAVQRARK
jgi:integrase